MSLNSASAYSNRDDSIVLRGGKEEQKDNITKAMGFLYLGWGNCNRAIFLPRRLMSCVQQGSRAKINPSYVSRMEIVSGGDIQRAAG